MASTTSTVPIGTLTKKMPRQLQSWAMRPPNTGPTMPPMGKMLENMARASVPIAAEVVGHDARRRRHEGAAADGLDQPEGHQHVDAGGQAACQRRHREDDRRQHVHVLAAVLIRHLAGQRHGHDLPKLVDGYGPGGPVDRGMQGPADRVQGGGHDGGVHRGHEQAERDDPEDQAPPGMRIAGVSLRADVRGAIDRDRWSIGPAVLSFASGAGAKIEHHDWLAYLNAWEVGPPPSRSASPAPDDPPASGVATFGRSRHLWRKMYTWCTSSSIGPLDVTKVGGRESGQRTGESRAGLPHPAGTPSRTGSRPRMEPPRSARAGSQSEPALRLAAFVRPPGRPVRLGRLGRGVDPGTEQRETEVVGVGRPHVTEVAGPRPKGREPRTDDQRAAGLAVRGLSPPARPGPAP